MKAAVLFEAKTPLQIEDISISKPGPREVLIRTMAVGVCRSSRVTCMTGQTSRQNLWLELKQLYAAFRHSSTSSSDGFPLVPSSERVWSAILGRL